MKDGRQTGGKCPRSEFSWGKCVSRGGRHHGGEDFSFSYFAFLHFLTGWIAAVNEMLLSPACATCIARPKSSIESAKSCREHNGVWNAKGNSENSDNSITSAPAPKLISITIVFSPKSNRIPRSANHAQHEVDGTTRMADLSLRQEETTQHSLNPNTMLPNPDVHQHMMGATG